VPFQLHGSRTSGAGSRNTIRQASKTRSSALPTENVRLTKQTSLAVFSSALRGQDACPENPRRNCRATKNPRTRPRPYRKPAVEHLLSIVEAKVTIAAGGVLCFQQSAIARAHHRTRHRRHSSAPTLRFIDAYKLLDAAHLPSCWHP